MPTIESELRLLEAFSGSEVIAIAINHESMTEPEVDATIAQYENTHDILATDVLLGGPDKLVQAIVSAFPELQRGLGTTCRPPAMLGVHPAVDQPHVVGI